MAPHPPRRGAEGARRDPGHDGADPRPGVCGREPAGPQPRQARHPRLPGRHQRAGLRGLWRLRRQEQLPVGATGRPTFGRKTRIDQTSCNFDFSCMEGDCPAFATVSTDAGAAQKRHRAHRARSTRCRRPPRADADRRPAIHRAPLRHRWHRGRHRQPDPRHGRDARRPHRARPRPDRPVAEGRTGHQRHPHHRSGTRRRTTPACRVSTPCWRSTCWPPPATRTAAAPRLIAPSSSPHPRRPTGEMVSHPTTPFPASTSLRERLDRGVAERANRYFDAANITNGLFGGTTTINIFMLGVAAQIGAVPVPTVPRAGDRAQRRRRRTQHRGVPLGTPAGRRRRRRREGRRARRPAAGDARRDDRTLRRRPRRLPVTSLRRSLPRHVDAFRRRADRRSQLDRAHRRGRPQPPQADGVQGRVRGGQVAAPDESRAATRRSVASARRSPTACTRRCCGRWV